MEELKAILSKFVDSGWELISVPSQKYLEGKCAKEDLIKAIDQANQECGSCGVSLILYIKDRQNY